MIEIWKDIKGYEGLYQISNCGNVKSLKTNKNLYLSDSKGYQRVGLYKGKRIMYAVHRLVAETFIPNPNNYPCVNHKDYNKKNNNVTNLEWCNHKYNNNYGSHWVKKDMTCLLKKIIIGYSDNAELIKKAQELNDLIKKI